MSEVDSLLPAVDGPLDTIVVLPQGFSGADMARNCREIAVDYLVRPGDYESELSVCPTCSHVAFDAASRKRGFCPLHAAPPSSQKRFTIPYPGLEAGFHS